MITTRIRLSGPLQMQSPWVQKEQSAGVFLDVQVCLALQEVSPVRHIAEAGDITATHNGAAQRDSIRGQLLCPEHAASCDGGSVSAVPRRPQCAALLVSLASLRGSPAASLLRTAARPVSFLLLIISFIFSLLRFIQSETPRDIIYGEAQTERGRGRARLFKRSGGSHL